ncbi:MAG TPA: hypothetical protein VEM15_11900 [Thermodesulfobacteriota bacterium]|nr:hypothetical protein [Thermodesulfobacteriota bacterium]
MKIWNRIYVWLSNRENLLFLVLILAHLVPVWVFQCFPSQDGPTHIENANIILDYFNPGRSILRDYYILNAHLEPTWLGHAVLAGLMCIVPIFIVEKIFISGYIVFLPLSIRYALRGIRPDAGFLTFLMFPFIYNYPLHMGFYSFSYSLSVFFFLVGYWIRNHNQLTLRKEIKLAFLSLLLYFCHIVSLAMAYAGIALLTGWFILFDLIQHKPEPRFDFRVVWKTFGRRVVPLILAFLPTVIVVLMFLSWRGVEFPEVGISRSFHWLLKDLVQMESLVSFQREESFCSIGLGVAFAGLFLYLVASKMRRRRPDRWDGLLVVVLGYLLIYLLAPNAISEGSFITDRLNLFPFFGFVLWFGVQPYLRSVKRGIVVVAIVIAAASLGLHTLKYSELNHYLTEYLSGINLIEPNKTLLPLTFDSRGHGPDGRVLSLKVRPFLHASGYIAARRHVVDFTNYEAGAFNCFPVLFRPNLNPYDHIGIKDRSIVWEPPQVDFLTYAGRTGGKVDYVLVWGIQERQRNHEATKSIDRQLKKGYELIYISPKTGLMQLYKRKPG